MNSTKKIFVVRAKPSGINREDQFLAGTVSIGWTTPKSLEGKDRSELERIVKKAYPDITSMSITQIYNFVQMPVGSIILTPSYINRDIHVFETVSEYSYNSAWPDNPHTIKVNHLKTLERNNFPEVVKRALLAAKRTVTNFTKYSNEIQMIIAGDTVDTDIKGAKLAQKSDDEIEARQTLKELLKSSDEEIRLKAALALLNK